MAGDRRHSVPSCRTRGFGGPGARAAGCGRRRGCHGGAADRSRRLGERARPGRFRSAGVGVAPWRDVVSRCDAAARLRAGGRLSGPSLVRPDILVRPRAGGCLLAGQFAARAGSRMRAGAVSARVRAARAIGDRARCRVVEAVAGAAFRLARRHADLLRRRVPVADCGRDGRHRVLPRRVLLPPGQAARRGRDGALCGARCGDAGRARAQRARGQFVERRTADARRVFAPVRAGDPVRRRGDDRCYVRHAAPSAIGADTRAAAVSLAHPATPPRAVSGRFDPPVGTLRLNPLYDRSGTRIFPTARYEAEYAALATYPDAIAPNLAMDAAAIRRRVFVDLPDRW